MRPGRARYWLLLLAGVLLPGPACAQQEPSIAEVAVEEYEEAISAAEAALREDPSDTVARRALTRALLDVGRYDRAVEAAATLPNLRGEALRALGQPAEAEAAFREAIAAAGPDQLTAEFNLAELLYMRGDRAEAMQRFDTFIDVYNNSTTLSSADLTAVGNAVWYLGTEEPQLFHDAVLAYDDAIAADRGDIEPHIRMAELFLEKYNSAEAATVLEEARAINPGNPRVLLGMARAAAFEGNVAAAAELVRESLTINPNLVPARVFLARMMIDTDEHARAQEELERALGVNPTSLEALSTLAALYYVRDDRDRYDATRQRVEQLNPTYAGLLNTVAEIAAQQRRYADAAELAAEATRIDGQFWAGFATLGLNQFRLGQIEEATASLERSFAGDPYNIWIKNNLDLLDTFADYRVVSLPGFELMLHEDEADVLLPYLEIAAAQAHAELSQRYGDRPRGPIRIEMYPRSADFSVRTVGLAGLGALGVSFGDVLALDAPSAREAGSYNWLTTLWHEMAHTVALGVSNSRVPRWLTEGLSVLEERRARPGWGYPITPEFLRVYDAGELPPVSRLNEGFIRPPTPQHLGHAYDMAALVGEWVEETRGFDAVVRMLHGYRDGRSTDDIFRTVLGSEPEEVDEDFDAWLRAKVDPGRAETFRDLFERGRQDFEAGNLELAKQSLEQAGELFPVAASGSSPYAVLAQIHLQEGNDRAAADALLRYTEFDETAYGANLELARLLESLGDMEGAAQALERAVWIYPYEPAPHLKLAELYGDQGQHDLAVRERRVVVALRPADQAEALYQLALARLEAGDREGARQDVLRALEAAPGFAEAQQLLLRVHEGT